MKECGICYLEKPENKFYNLTCCKNHLCLNCKERIFQPYCPYCRQLVFRTRSLTTGSIESNNNISFRYLESMDDLYVESRWYRRRIRRMERERQIRINNEMNRRMSQTNNRPPPTNRRQRTYQHYNIKKEIEEYKNNKKN